MQEFLCFVNVAQYKNIMRKENFIKMKNNKLRIVLPDVKNVTYGDLDLSIFEKYGEVITYPTSKTEELAKRLEGADVILCNKTLLNENTLKNAPNLKYIGLFATGYNNVDLEYTNSKNVVVSNAGSYSTESVAQHTFALILNHYNKINEYSKFTSEGRWIGSETFSPFIYPMGELNNKTIGIIGFGSIGVKVAKIARAFDMNIVAYSRNIERVKETIDREFSKEDIYNNKIIATDLENLVKVSDIVTLHCPLNNESDKLIDKELLRKFKKGSYLVNTSRGGVINEEDLIEALEEEWLSGAALDVINTEPMSTECKLLNTKNITITPHIAWAPYETRKRLLDIVEENLASFIEGNPKNVVSK